MPGGKIVLVTTANDKVVVSRLLSNGAPDPTFDNDGQAVIQAAHALRGYAVAIEPDGKIIVAGSMGNSLPGTDAAVWRLKADGGSGSPNSALDPTFDADGVALIDSTQEEYAEAVGIQPDGRIVIAGRTYNSPGPANVGVWRLLPDGGTGAVNGALDDSFDTDGAAGIGDGGYDDAQGLALQPDGKILVAGESDIDAPARNAVVWRLQANGGPGGFNGALDTTFDTDGRASINAGGDEVATGIALAPDGKVVVSGRTSSAPNGSAAIVWRLKADGALDPAFGTSGAALVDSGGYARGAAVRLQPDGKILLAGSTKVGTNPEAAAVWRLAPNGGAGAINDALDPAFGTGGAVTVAPDPGASVEDLVLMPDRRIVAAGALSGGNALVFRVLGDPFSLTVAKAGTGAGSVQSSPGGVDCGAACSGSFDDASQVSLTAAAAAGSAFTGWSGAGCTGTGLCAVTMNADQTVTATFDALPLPAKHFVLKAGQLSMRAFRRSARTARAAITGLPAGTRISASLLGRRSVSLAKAKATAGANGRASLTFRFSKKGRKRLRSAKLKRVTLRVTATPTGDTASKASKRVKLRRARR